MSLSTLVRDLRASVLALLKLTQRPIEGIVPADLQSSVTSIRTNSPTTVQVTETALALVQTSMAYVAHKRSGKSTQTEKAEGERLIGVFQQAIKALAKEQQGARAPPSPSTERRASPQTQPGSTLGLQQPPQNALNRTRTAPGPPQGHTQADSGYGDFSPDDYTSSIGTPSSSSFDVGYFQDRSHLAPASSNSPFAFPVAPAPYLHPYGNVDSDAVDMTSFDVHVGPGSPRARFVTSPTSPRTQGGGMARDALDANLELLAAEEDRIRRQREKMLQNAKDREALSPRGRQGRPPSPHGISGAVGPRAHTQSSVNPTSRVNAVRGRGDPRPLQQQAIRSSSGDFGPGQAATRGSPEPLAHRSPSADMTRGRGAVDRNNGARVLAKANPSPSPNTAQAQAAQREMERVANIAARAASLTGAREDGRRPTLLVAIPKMEAHWSGVKHVPKPNPRANVLLSRQRKETPASVSLAEPVNNYTEPPRAASPTPVEQPEEEPWEKVPFDAEGFENARCCIEAGNIPAFRQSIANLNVNMQDEDDECNTLLHWAVGYNSVAMARELLLRGARPLANTHGLTPLELATQAYLSGDSSFFALKQLLEQGVGERKSAIFE